MKGALVVLALLSLGGIASAMGDSGGFSHTIAAPISTDTPTPVATPGGIPGSPQFNFNGLFDGISSTLYADSFVGDWCGKVAVAVATLPSQTGTVDASNLIGPQVCAETLTIPPNVRLLVGSTTLTLAPGQQILLSRYASLIGLGPITTQINSNVVGDAVVRSINGQPNVTIANLRVYNSDNSSVYSQPTNSGGSAALRIDNSANANVYNVRAEGGYYAAMITSSSYYGHWSSIDIGSQGIAKVGLYINEASDQTFDKLAIGGVPYAIDNEWALAVTVNNLDCENGGVGTACIVADREVQPSGAAIAQMVVNGGYEQGYNYLVDAEDSATHGVNPPSIMINGLHLQGIGIAACTGPYKSQVLVTSPAYGVYPGCTTITTDGYGGVLVNGNVPAISLYDGTNTISLAQAISGTAVLRDQNNQVAPLSVGDLNALTLHINGVAGVSCSGPPSSQYAVVNGIVTHC